MVGVDDDPDGYLGLNTAVQQGGAFSLSDLEGTWWYTSYWDDPASSFGEAGWDDLQIKNDGSGIVTFKGGTGSNGVARVEILDAQFSIDASGVVGIPSLPEAHMKMSPDKEVILGVLTEDAGQVTTVVMVKLSGGFVQADITSHWYYYVLFDGKFINRAGWVKGEFDLDLEDPFGNLTFPVQLNADANFGAGVQSTGPNRIFTIMVAPEPSTQLAYLTSLLVLGFLRVRSSSRH